MSTKISKADLAKSSVPRQPSRRSKEVAPALDARAEVLTHARVFTSVQFEEFVTELTPKRFELLRLALKSRRSINDLANAAHREPSAVSRDIARLVKLGLVRVDLVPNPGHGQMKMVTPVAERISINADLRPS